MPSLIDLRRRIRSVKNTQQITKAMKMVAASKLRRAQERIMSARPYATQMQRVLESVAAHVDPSIHPLLSMREVRPDSKTLVIIVTADKGLCGSFNTNAIKAGGQFVVDSPQQCSLGLVGRKGREYFGRRGFNVLFEQIGIFQKLGPESAQMPAARDVKRLAPLEPTMRTVEVLQFCSWSAWSRRMRLSARETSGMAAYSR